MNTNAKSKRTKVYHFMLLLLCVSMTVFTTGCSNDSENLLPTEATDDASLVAAQLKQLQRTRANDAYNTVIITTGKQIAFNIQKNSSILVDWGDGNKEYDTFSHTYTDNFPAHTICLYCTPDCITGLSISGQSLIYLDITKTPALEVLSCTNNRLTELDVTQNPNLQQLFCGTNSLQQLDISQNPALIFLTCTDNQLTALNTSANKQLSIASCKNNKITTLDLTLNTRLVSFNCQNNSLTTLTLPNTLGTLSCSDNQLTSLDLSNNTKLTHVYCDNNQLVTLNLANNKELTTLNCGNNQLISLDISTCTQLYIVTCYNNRIADIMIPQGSPLSQVECYNNPFEQDTYGQVFRLVGNLPSKQADNKGSITFSATIPLLSMIQSICTGKNWDVALK